MASMAKTMADLKQLTRTHHAESVELSKARDTESGKVSAAIYWSCDEVADYIEVLGFPQYRVGDRQSKRARDSFQDAAFSPRLGMLPSE